MNKKNIQPNPNEIVIPELDEIMKTYRHTTPWTNREEAIVKKYFRRVPDTKLALTLKRTTRSIIHKAAALGVKEGTG